MAMKLSAVNRCIEVLSASMGKLPVYLIDRNTRDRKNHDVLHLLNVRPNEAMTPTVRKQMLEANRLTMGNAYDWIIRSPKTGRPVELIPVPSELVTPWRDMNWHIWYDIIHPLTGEPMTVSGEDICHYKAYSHDGLRGISVLQRARETISTGLAAQDFGKSFYEGDAQPSGALTVDADLSGYIEKKLPDGSTVEVSLKDNLREEWAKHHGGPKNAHRIAILDHGLKYQQISTNPADAQFIETAGLTVVDIARFFGVPLYKLFAGNQSYKSNEQNSIEYVVGTLHPIVSQYEEEQTYKLLVDSELSNGLELRINMMAELKGDFASRGVWYKNMRETGAFSVNDILALEDMPDVEGGDEHYASWNYGPLSEWRALSIKRAGQGGK
jgi:HK97 family phage portal protein